MGFSTYDIALKYKVPEIEDASPTNIISMESVTREGDYFTGYLFFVNQILCFSHRRRSMQRAEIISSSPIALYGAVSVSSRAI